jgi:hypothetical protein
VWDLDHVHIGCVVVTGDEYRYIDLVDVNVKKGMLKTPMQHDVEVGEIELG